MAEPLTLLLAPPAELTDETIERAVLACCLQDGHYEGTAAEVIAAGVTPEWFSAKPRQLVMQAIADLHSRGERIDLLSLRSLIADADATAWAEALYADLHDAYQIGLYVERLRELVIRRRVHGLAVRLLSRCVAVECSTLVADLRSGAEGIEAGVNQGSGIVSLGEALRPVLAEMERGVDEILGVPTGFADIDALLLGLEPGRLYVLGARPRVGKTVLATNVATHVASRGHRVLYVTLEMTQKELAERGLSAYAPVDYRALRQGKLRPDEKSNAIEAAAQAAEWPFDLWDTSGIGIPELHSACRFAARQSPLALVIVDYMQLMRGRGTNREQEVASVSRGLKALAKTEGVAVLALSQLSREIEKKGPDARPNLSDLRESGAVEQDADVVAFLFREELVSPNDPKLKGKAEFIVRKNRGGEERTIELVWQGHYQRYRSVARPGQREQYRQMGFGGAA